MKKKKLTGKQIKLIINLISFTIFAVSYFYVYTGYLNKTEAANKEIETVKAGMKDHEQKLAEEDSVRKDIEDVKAQSQAIMDNFPVQIAKEDNFMFVEKLQQSLDIKITSIDTTDSSALYQTILPIRGEDGKEAANTNTASEDATQQTASDQGQNASSDSAILSSQDTAAASTSDKSGAAETSDNGTASVDTTSKDKETTKAETMTGTQSVINLTFQTNYAGFKKLADYIRDYPDRSIIDSASVSYDNSTGELTGSMVIKRFALTGTGKVYEPPYITDISIGTDNIFGTVSDQKAEKTDKQ